MVTDRCSTAGILFVLAGLYPSRQFVFLCLMFIDIFSHWIHVQRCVNVHVCQLPVHCILTSELYTFKSRLIV